MRSSLSTLLAIMLSLNAAYVVSVGVCDALEHTSIHTTHLGHHSHGHSDGHDHDDKFASVDETDQTTSASDHLHFHVHPGFSTILPDVIGVTPLTGGSIKNAIPAEILISVPPTLLERPPRATLA
jgi:hypothetical protein